MSTTVLYGHPIYFVMSCRFFFSERMVFDIFLHDDDVAGFHPLKPVAAVARKISNMTFLLSIFTLLLSRLSLSSLFRLGDYMLARIDAVCILHLDDAQLQLIGNSSVF